MWVAQAARETILRIDAGEHRLVGELRLGATPRDLTADGDDLWVSVSSPTATFSACGSMQRPAGAAADAVVAADLPLRSGGRSPIAPMVSAIQQTLSRHGYRAGAHRVGLLVCDDSTAERGTHDPAKCRANARAYAADRRIVAEIGPYNSPCAYEQLPIAAAAPGGPLAVVSPTTTDPLLNRPGTGRAAGAYARVVAADDRQAQVAARFLRDRGHRHVFVLDDGDRYGLDAASYFAAGARAAGLTVVGRATWDGARRDHRRHPARAARPPRRGLRERRARQRRRAGRPLAAPRARAERDARRQRGPPPCGPALRPRRRRRQGVLIATGTRPSAAPHPFADLATKATEAALAAIARSDGTRRSVARALRSLPQFDAIGDLKRAPVTILRATRPGGSRTNMSLEGGRVVTIVR